MIVKELLEVLKQVDENAVIAHDVDMGGYFPIAKVEVRKLFLEKSGVYNPYVPEKTGSVEVLCIS